MKAVVLVKIIKGEINPFDASALECALKYSENVTVISMSPLSCENELKRIARLGVDVIHICDSIYAGSDTLVTSKILKAAIEKINPSVVFCGRQTIDGDTAQVGPCTATLLDFPVITNIMEIKDINDKTVICKTRSGIEKENFPCLLTIEKSYTLRLPKLRSESGIYKRWDNNVLNLKKEECGYIGSPTHVIKSFENKSGRRKCKFISASDLILLINTLKQSEDKFNKKTIISNNKLPLVWTIGNVSSAKLIAENIIEINEKDPVLIAKKAKKEKPEVILWNADLWGRRNAPVVQALLNTGLCADCIALETDGEKLLMTRPAGGGNIIAQIECLTMPQMATVRCENKTSDIIVSGGRGIKNDYRRFLEFSEMLGAQIGASRGLVDDSFAGYNMQIGLTGKSVSPKIYIAIGISGAVHHTCAIENSQYIIAINPDKKARIFEYADFGIIDNFEAIPY